MVDYSIDGSYRAERTEWSDFRTVSGYEEFEQDLAVQFNYRMSDIVGSTSRNETIREKIKLTISRIARDFGVINEIASVNVERGEGGEYGYEVEIVYLADRGSFEEVY